MFTFHTRIALLTLLPLLVWIAVRFVKQQRAIVPVPLPPIHIGIEHAGNAAVTLTRTKDTQPQLIDIANEGRAAIHISVPADWKRGEVRGVPLASITMEEPIFGYGRWHLPAGGTLTFENPLPSAAWTIQNPSRLSLRLRVITVNLQKKTTERETYLLAEAPLTVE